jgi:hypothetical protein
VSKVNADQVDYVLGVYRGVVRCVIKPTSKWKPSDKKSKDTRYYIEGITDDVRGNELYLNKNVKEFPFPSGGAIRYIRDCVESTVEKLPAEFIWEARLWEPIKAEMLKHVKVKMTIPKGRPYVIIQSVANKGKIACGISYSVRESEVYVWMETYQGEEMKEKILNAISRLSSDHPLQSAELGQGKKNKNKWAWSIKQQIDKTDTNLVKWCSDRILAIYIAMENMVL